MATLTGNKEAYNHANSTNSVLCDTLSCASNGNTLTAQSIPTVLTNQHNFFHYCVINIAQ